jgi:NADP-dependent 3-hydroxy acid dehydrogenase YdfG
MRAFTGQVAVITGASSGIGRAIAEGLGAQGVTLCLLGRQSEALKAVVDRVSAMTPVVFSFRADLVQDGDIQELTTRLERGFGSVDILVHSAGVFALDPMDRASVADFDWQYQTNVRAPYVLTKALLPMLRQHHGQVVFINSSAGLTARATVGQYAATKHALKAIADSLREEVNADGLRVLSVFVGRTATPMQAAIHELEGKAYHPDRLLQPTDVAAVVINALSLPRTAEVTDIHIRPFIKP